MLAYLECELTRLLQHESLPGKKKTAVMGSTAFQSISGKETHAYAVKENYLLFFA